MTVKKTNSRHRSFATKKSADLEPLGFDIDDESFTARPAIPGAVILDFIAAGQDGGLAIATQLINFYESALEPSEFARFQKKIYDPDVIVDEELLGEIVAYLVEEYTSRPSAASSESDETS